MANVSLQKPKLMGKGRYRMLQNKTLKPSSNVKIKMYKTTMDTS